MCMKRNLLEDSGIHADVLQPVLLYVFVEIIASPIQTYKATMVYHSVI